MSKIAVRRALISVYDKTGLDVLAPGLHAAGVEIVSTGSTAALIRSLGVPVTAVDEVTGFPEILGGRGKTLHPHIHAGLLADQGDDEHVETVEKLGIDTFQLVVSNLYPFTATVASGATPPEIIEQIDIGGPAMVRASAQKHGCGPRPRPRAGWPSSSIRPATAMYWRPSSPVASTSMPAASSRPRRSGTP